MPYITFYADRQNRSFDTPTTLNGCWFIPPFANGNQVRIKTLCSLSFLRIHGLLITAHTISQLSTQSLWINQVRSKNIMGELFVPGDYTFTAPKEMDYVR